MMNLLIAAAAAVAQPASWAEPADMHAQNREARPAEHKDCCKDGCKDCCDDMKRHEGHGADHGRHAG